MYHFILIHRNNWYHHIMHTIYDIIDQNSLRIVYTWSISFYVRHVLYEIKATSVNEILKVHSIIEEKNICILKEKAFLNTYMWYCKHLIIPSGKSHYWKFSRNPERFRDWSHLCSLRWPDLCLPVSYNL